VLNSYSQGYLWVTCVGPRAEARLVLELAGRTM